ncbi:MAG: SUMF1/EgtB/PvdO family nonheme iron enzyme [Cyanobacteria bacterium J06598_1]
MSKNWAICIGINGYKFVSPLRFARRDAYEMGQFCEGELRFERVFYFAESLPDGEPVSEIVVDGQSVEASPTFGNLSWFLDAQFRKKNFLNPQDNLWFFFAGHGVRDGGIDYLLPIDGNAAQIKRTGLPIHEVAERLRRSGAGNIVLMLDACRSGDERDMSLTGIEPEPQQGVVTLFSCGANERSYEVEALQQGLFTYALLEALRLDGPSNCATVDRLGRRLKQRVTELGEEYGKPRQTTLIRAEPIEKKHLVLLPDKAEPHDATPLRDDARKAELNGDLALARQFWICVLAVIRADMDAIQGLERIAVKRANIPQTAKTLGLNGARVEEISIEAKEAVATERSRQDEKTTIQTFSFEVITVDDKGQMVRKETKQANCRQETLAEGVDLEMVSIPGGTFLMGSSAGEGYNSERPQHLVTIEPFWMGRYPVTQAQWSVIAALPKVEFDLTPAPSEFVSSSRPVEKVSWSETVEFCKRLSRQSEYEYRLPSEAEWEYACRAGMTTPFSFGETLTAELVNYNATRTYGNGPKGEFRAQTTTVGSFPANAFGLYDMHGNVREWCSDHWHENYVSTPVSGVAWLSPHKDAQRVIRGGSWSSLPRFCRSAFRYASMPDNRNFLIGFRVSCSAPRT